MSEHEDAEPPRGGTAPDTNSAGEPGPPRDPAGEPVPRGVTGDGDIAGAAGLIRGTLDVAVRRLENGRAPDQALAIYTPPRRRLLVTRRATMLPNGRVWRLGVFLLGHDGTLRATGSITRASEPGHANYQSLSGEARREIRAAAARADFAPDETVNFNAPVIELDAASLTRPAGPLFLRDGAPMVRWSPTLGDEAALPFERYLTERVELLLHPPEGA